jgi:hypothetical protein
VIEIVYPQPMQVPHHEIERWFAAAVAEQVIPPEKLSAKTPQEMAEALENIGWIYLARQ